MASGPNSLAYKLLWRGSDKFGSLVPNSRPAGGAKDAAKNVNSFDDAEDDDEQVAEGEENAEPRRVRTTLTSDEESDADVELVKAATEKVKTKRGAPKFDQMVLCGKRGLPMLHDELRKVKFRGAGSETADLHLLVRKYKEWCFAMFPSMPFEPLVDKIGALSGNKIVQNFVSRMHENLERGLPMQDLALGVERSHDAYVPSDDEEQALDVFVGNQADGDQASQPRVAAQGDDEEEDYDQLLRMADQEQRPAAAPVVAKVAPGSPLAAVSAPAASQTRIVSSQVAPPPKPANPFAAKPTSANPFGVATGGFKAPFRAPTNSS